MRTGSRGTANGREILPIIVPRTTDLRLLFARRNEYARDAILAIGLAFGLCFQRRRLVVLFGDGNIFEE